MIKKKVIITGANGQIGRAFVKTLTEKNFFIYAIDLNIEKISTSENVQPVKLDITDEIAVYNFFSTLQNLDVLINNAGVGVRKSLDELNIEDFLKVFNVNVFGLALFTKEIIPYMIKESYGTIINIGSTASLKGYKNGSIYSSSKFAVRCLTQCWQAELRSHNIRVCQVNPSEVTTAFGNSKRVEREDVDNKLTPKEISHSIISAIEMDDRGFVNELNIWATNPFN